MTEREAFEAWATSELGLDLAQDNGGHYKEITTYCAWQAWHASGSYWLREAARIAEAEADLADRVGQRAAPPGLMEAAKVLRAAAGDKP